MFKGNNMNEEIILKSENGVGIITLNRPERLNALTYNIVKKMNNFLDKCESDDDIKCVIIEGAGEKAFSPAPSIITHLISSSLSHLSKKLFIFLTILYVKAFNLSGLFKVIIPTPFSDFNIISSFILFPLNI